MADVTEYRTALPRESEIEGRLDELVGLMAAGTATPADYAEYQELLASRARLMRPPAVHIRIVNAARRYARV